MSTNSNGIFSWIRRVFSRAARPIVARGRRRGFVPYLELLEIRDVPTIFTVTTLSDIAVDGEMTLRQALGNVFNLGTANNVIQFKPGLTGTINLTAALPDPEKNVDIAGPGPGVLTVAGNPTAENPFDIFNFATANTNILFSGLTIRDGRTLRDTDTGAGIYANGPNLLTISNCSFINCIAGRAGGAVEAHGVRTVDIYDTYFGGNEALSQGGGAIRVDNRQAGDTLTVSNCTFNGNQAAGSGGAIWLVDGNANIVSSTFTYNGSFNGQGGAIYYGADEGAMVLAVAGSTFYDNQAPNGSGGAIYDAQATGTIYNSTFTGNTARNFGGAIYDVGRRLSETNDTVVGNSAAVGGGICVIEFATGTGAIVNCIVAGNSATTAGANVSGPFNSNGNNLIGFTTGSSGWAASDLTGTALMPLDPLLNPLGNYGGINQTMPPQAGSPAIDAGDNGLAVDANGDLLAIDQRGFTRVVNGTIDIGAVEVQANEPGVSDICLSTSENPAVYGDNVTLSANVAAAYSTSGTPGGSVTFDDGTTALGTDDLDGSGNASISVNTLTVGDHTITAVYSGDSTFNSETSSPTDLSVLQATPTVTVSVDGGTYNGSQYDDATDTVAGVTSSDDTPAASLEGIAPNLVYIDSNGNQLDDAPTAAGTYTVQAIFPGSTDYTIAEDDTTFTISPADLTITASDVTMTYADSTTLDGSTGFTASGLQGSDAGATRELDWHMCV